MSVDLTGKVAIVTGATRGIGRALTLAFAANGADVVGSARNPGPAAALADEVRQLGRRFTFVEADVSDLAACDRVAAAAVDAHGRLDILINNAGTSLPQVRIEDLTEDDWRAVAGPTLEGTLFMSRAVLPAMLAQGNGVIINVASAAGVAGMATMGAYGLSKAAAIHLAKVIAVENLGRGVRANALIVGAVATELSWGSLVAHAQAVHGPDFNPAPPSPNGGSAMGALMLQPEGLANAVMLLCSDDAQEINGATIAVDRAFSAGAPASTLVSMAAAGMTPA
jgi:3-oxoacyl-[acyl-carrier protein] reductase